MSVIGLRAVEQRARAEEVEVHRHVVVGVDAGGDDDVDVGGRGDPGDAGDVAAQADHGEVDDGVHAAGLELVEPGDRRRPRVWPRRPSPRDSCA